MFRVWGSRFRDKSLGQRAPPVVPTLRRPLPQIDSPLQPPVVRPRLTLPSEPAAVTAQTCPSLPQTLRPHAVSPAVTTSLPATGSGNCYTMREAWEAALNAEKHRWLALLSELLSLLPSNHDLVQLQIWPLWTQHAMRLVAANAPSTLNSYQELRRTHNLHTNRNPSYLQFYGLHLLMGRELLLPQPRICAASRLHSCEVNGNKKGKSEPVIAEEALNRKPY